MKTEESEKKIITLILAQGFFYDIQISTENSALKLTIKYVSLLLVNEPSYLSFIQKRLPKGLLEISP